MAGEDDKAARLANALRANLKRRKTQARAAEVAPGNPPADAPDGQRAASDPIE